jgi:hypothetical protein
MPSVRRFPPSWTTEETDACYIVRDANGQAMAYVASFDLSRLYVNASRFSTSST